MKNKIKILSLQLLIIGILAIMISSCEKESTLPVVTTADVTEIQSETATSGGEITDDGGADIIARGVCWSTNEMPTIMNNKTLDGTGTGSFSSSLADLTPNTTYYVRAYATNLAGIAYGNQVSFTTESGVITDKSILVVANGDSIFKCKFNGSEFRFLAKGTVPRLNYSNDKIAFVSKETGSWQVYTMDTAGNNVLQITTIGVSGGQNNGGSGQVDWTTDNKILFMKANKLYKMNSDGTNIVEIATAPVDNWVDVHSSPTGNKIAAETQGGWGYTLAIYMMNSDGSNISIFASDLAGGQSQGGFSPDGLNVLYSYDLSGHEESSGRGLNHHIFSKPIDGSASVDLSINKLDGYNDSRPIYSSDGNKIFFNYVKNDGSFGEIWVMNADGTERSRLINKRNLYFLDCK